MNNKIGTGRYIPGHITEIVLSEEGYGKVMSRIAELEKERDSLRAALIEACGWNWLDHQGAFDKYPFNSGAMVPSSVCKQMFQILAEYKNDD